MNSILANNGFFNSLSASESLVENLKYKLTKDDLFPIRACSPAARKCDSINTALCIWAQEQIRPKCRKVLNEYAKYMSGCELGSLIPHRNYDHCYQEHICTTRKRPYKFEHDETIKLGHVGYAKMRSCRLQTLIDSEELMDQLSSEYAESLLREIVHIIHECDVPTEFEVISVEFDNILINPYQYLSWSEEEASKNDGDGVMCTFSPNVHIKRKYLQIDYTSIEQCRIEGKDQAKNVAKIVKVIESHPSCGHPHTVLRREQSLQYPWMPKESLRYPWMYIIAWRQYKQSLEVLRDGHPFKFDYDF